MGDPVLDAYRVAPSFYILGGSLAPVSIRDQMVRGQWLVERLWEKQLVSPAEAEKGPVSDLPVVIVGAGVAGVAAALTAARKKVLTWVFERERMPFSLQAGCTTRWIDPTQYDWPARSWVRASARPISPQIRRSSVQHSRHSMERAMERRLEDIARTPSRWSTVSRSPIFGLFNQTRPPSPCWNCRPAMAGE